VEVLINSEHQFMLVASDQPEIVKNSAPPCKNVDFYVQNFETMTNGAKSDLSDEVGVFSN